MKLLNIALGISLLVALGSSRPLKAETAGMDQGIDSVEVIKATATVEKIDLEKRKVTLLLDNGKHKTFKVDKSVQNLDQVKVDDHLKISFTEEVVVLVGNSSQPSAGGGCRRSRCSAQGRQARRGDGGNLRR